MRTWGLPAVAKLKLFQSSSDFSTKSLSHKTNHRQCKMGAEESKQGHECEEHKMEHTHTKMKREEELKAEVQKEHDAIQEATRRETS